MHIKSVAFFGCSCGEEGDKNYDSAKATASAVAKSGRTVVNGGGPGIMLASTLGAREVGGKTEIVYYRPELATNFDESTAANYAEKSTEEANYILRTKKLLEISDAYIVFNGGTGTISEFAMAWGVARLYIDHHKPLILFGDFWHEIIDAFKKNMLLRPEEQRVYTIVNTPEAAVESLEGYEEILKENHRFHETCRDRGPECSLLL